MSSPIQTLPLGLLGLLGLKNNGVNPPEMIDKVQPVLDLEKYYLSGIRTWNTTLATAALGQTASTIVDWTTGTAGPAEGKIWVVERYTVQATVPAAGTATADFAPGAARANNLGAISGYTTLGPQVRLAAAAPAVIQGAFAPADGTIILLPRERLTVSLGSIITAASTVTFFGTALVSEFTI